MYLYASRWILAFLALLGSSAFLTAGEAAGNKQKLKIVFLMGQSNMVGYARPETAWYLTQPMYVPPAKLATYKPRYFDWGFYWSGVKYAYGDSDEYNAKGEELLAERHASRRLWRQRVYGNFGRNATRNDWDEKRWGPPVIPGRKTMEPFLHKKAEEEGVYKRMEEHIESPENRFHPTVALKQMSKRDEPIAGDIKRVRKIFLKGTSPEDFDALADALKEFGRVEPSNRLAYAELVRDKVNLPIAERSWISAFGQVTGEPTDVEYDKIAQGPLAIGYAAWASACGPEYPFGISFERMVDGLVDAAIAGEC